MRFASDNSGPVHPKVIEALMAANEGWANSYGDDDWTRRATEKMKSIFEAPDATVYFVATGTAANALLLATLVQPYQTVFCTPEAHIHMDECNAPEFFTGGAKLTLVESHDARMEPDALARTIETLGQGGIDSPEPGAVSLTSVTERGTVYTLDQIRAIADIAHAAGCPVHLDGARFANAMVALETTPAEMTWRAGIDAVSFGGTKNGLMGVEAMIVFDPGTTSQLARRRKRGGHLFSKSRFLGAQMDTYLTDDLWITLARQANDNARELVTGLREIPGVTFQWPPEANMVFPHIPRAAHRRLHEAGATYHLWGGPLEGDPSEPILARLVCDWSGTDENTARFLDLVRG